MLSDDVFALPVVPPSPRRPAVPVLASLAPVLGGVALWLITGSMFALWFAVLGPVIALGGLLDSLRARRRERRRHEREYALALQSLRERLDASLDRRRTALEARHPDVAGFASDARRGLAPGARTRRHRDRGTRRPRERDRGERRPGGSGCRGPAARGRERAAPRARHRAVARRPRGARSRAVGGSGRAGAADPALPHPPAHGAADRGNDARGVGMGRSTAAPCRRHGRRRRCASPVSGRAPRARRGFGRCRPRLA